MMTGTYAHKFVSSDVNTSNNTIRWVGHQLEAGDVLLYVPSSGDTHVGGLQRFQIYYVKSAPDADTITLCETTNGNYSSNSVINLTSQGTSTYGRHQLILGYEIRRAVKNSSNYRTYFQTRYNRFGSGSGRDFTAYTQDPTTNRYGYYGLGGKMPPRYLLASKTGKTLSSGVMTSSMPMYSTSRNSNFTFGKSGTVPDGWDFIEDFTRFNSTSSYYTYGTGNNFNNHYYYSRTNSNGSIGIDYFNWFNYSPYYDENYNAEEVYIFFLQKEEEADTLYVPNHGFSTGAGAIINTSSGLNISKRNDTGTSWNTSPSFSDVPNGGVVSLTVVSENRIKVHNRIRSAAGQYSIQGAVTNPTKNSFYFAGHDFIDKQRLTFSTTGSVPTTTSGPVTPNLNSLDVVYNAVKSNLNTLVSDMGSEHTNLIFDGNQPYSPFNANYTRYDDGVQYFYWQTSRLYLYTQPNSRYYQSPYFYSDSETQTKLRSEDSWDPFAATDAAGKGFYYKMTPYSSRNSTVPFWIEGFQVPDLSLDSNNRCYYYAEWLEISISWWRTESQSISKL